MSKVRETSRMRPLKNAPGVYMIEGKTGDWITIVRGVNKTCTCPDYIYRRFDGSNCKHIDAASLVIEAERRAFEMINTPKPSEEAIAKEAIASKNDEKELHQCGEDMYYGETKINSFEELDKAKKLDMKNKEMAQ
jgi:predicted nucleic acid-binding Zn finger protein